MEEEKIAMLALHAVPGVGDILLKQLVSYCGAAREVFRRPVRKLATIPGVGPSLARRIHQHRHDAEATAIKVMRRSEKEDTQICCYHEPAYPQRLRQIEDAPSILFVKGNINLNHRKAVGIVGTRNATDYGKMQVENILTALQPHEPLVISGLAYGIDIHAHKQALALGLATVGVMGSGIDIIYPYVHREIASRMTSQGALVTENHFGVKPDAHHFPARNRIIAGMCDAIIVVEAKLRGGALITAEMANAYNKDVFAIPGNLDAPYSEGCNWLIKTSKAHLYSSIDDLEYIMNWDRQPPQAPAQLSLDLALASPEELVVLQVIREAGGQLTADEIVIRSGLTHTLAAAYLLSLELKQMLQVVPGKSYRLRSHVH